jgi:hypothetical protein
MTTEYVVITERHVSPDSTVKQPLLFRHASSPPLFAARGRRRRCAFPPPCERACGTPGARCTLGPDANAVFRNSECIRTFGGAEQVPDVPHAVFFRLLALCLSERSDHRIKVPRRWEGSLKRVSRTRFDLVVRHTVQGSFHPKAGRLLASGSAGADPSCPKTDVTHEPRNAASPASTASCPANVTIAIAPLGGAGRRGI